MKGVRRVVLVSVPLPALDAIGMAEVGSLGCGDPGLEGRRTRTQRFSFSTRPLLSRYLRVPLASSQTVKHQSRSVAG